MHITGLLGMPRRIYTYQPGRGWDVYNHLETAGAYLLALGVLLYILNAVISYYRGREAGDNPWNADTLEWTTSSPPPPYNFARIPIVKSKNPAWEPADQADAPVLDSMRETLGTTVLDAEPEGRILIPPDSILPLVLAVALALFFIGFIADLPPLAVIGVLGALAALAVWFWPTDAVEAPA
jgi:cytochrome c oxidase subunit 1/cytochrome c oxidase subunit I+III